MPRDGRSALVRRRRPVASDRSGTGRCPALRSAPRRERPCGRAASLRCAGGHVPRSAERKRVGKKDERRGVDRATTLRTRAALFSLSFPSDSRDSAAAFGCSTVPYARALTTRVFLPWKQRSAYSAPDCRRPGVGQSARIRQAPRFGRRLSSGKASQPAPLRPAPSVPFAACHGL